MILQKLLTYPLSSRSWEVKRFSTSQKNPRILLELMVHYHVYKCPPPVPILSQIDPVHAPQIPLPEDQSDLYRLLPRAKQYISFPPLRSYQIISPSPMHMYLFRNKARLYG